MMTKIPAASLADYWLEVVVNVIYWLLILAVYMLINFTFCPILGWQISWYQNLALSIVYVLFYMVRVFIAKRIHARLAHEIDDVHLGV